jgi:hypothetical protein
MWHNRAGATAWAWETGFTAGNYLRGVRANGAVALVSELYPVVLRATLTKLLTRETRQVSNVKLRPDCHDENLAKSLLLVAYCF